MPSEDDPSETVKSLVKRRATVKAKITNQLVIVNADGSLVNVTNCIALIEEYLVEIKRYDSKICDLLAKDCSDEDFIPDTASAELSKQTRYVTNITNKLSHLKAGLPSPKASATVPQQVSAPDGKLKLPELRCSSFSGEGTNSLDFHAFITEFNNIVGSRRNISDSCKLTYLKTYLKGYANKLVQHLQVSDENYSIALDLLKLEFLNVESLVDELLKKLLRLKPEYDPTYLKTKVFLGEVRCIVSDLNQYGYDYMKEKAGSKMLSHIVFNNLPLPFKQELARKLNNNYPSLADILEGYVEVIKTLNLRPSTNKPVYTGTKSPSVVSRATTNDNQSKMTDRPVQGARNSDPSRSKPRLCKFCVSSSHNMSSCHRYGTHEARAQRCSELGMCVYCSSARHSSENCKKNLDYPCYLCKSKEHITALCDKNRDVIVNNFCVNSSDSGRTFLLPMVNLEIEAGRTKTRVRFLLDTGSQRSYLSTSVIQRLKLNLLNKTNLTVNTFIDNSSKSFFETSITVNTGKNKCSIPFLINDSFDLRLNIDSLVDCHDNISKRFKLQEKLDSDQVLMEGLLGVDMIQCLGQLSTISCLGGTAFKLSSGIVPFGNIDNFLTNEQLKMKYETLNNTNAVNESIVNYVLNPVPTDFDPIGSVATDSLVDKQLDRMFSSETLGLPSEISSYDEQKIDEFKSNINFKDGKYHVNLPWNDHIGEVSNNYSVSLAVLRRVVEKLHQANLYDDYEAVLLNQVSDGILEEIPASEIGQSDHVFVPHRPVVKEESSTTKVRVVLNCSMKVRDSFSLNEAAYSGIDLVNNLFQLLIKIRADDYLVLSDIRAAFLMIKLNLDSDKNKFTILWQDRTGRLIYYRYTSIVFGFTSSPFILQYVIRHHLQKFESDKCFEILKNGMYVDNLFYTGNDTNELLNLYRQASERMSAGGFDLRSWSSNCSELDATFRDEGTSAPSDSGSDKLLGYRYLSSCDEIKIAQFNTNDSEVPTKRTILSYIARLFDPLGLCLPVVVSARLLLRKIWQLKLGWDDPVPREISDAWTKIKRDFDQLPNLSFSRSAYRGDVSLLIFCDSSQTMYGFSVYAKNSTTGNCTLLFAKSKSAPTKAKSLPTLELMAVYLALSCLPTILDSIKATVHDVTIGVDAQVVLSWILSGKINSKNICARNRLKDVTKFRSEVKETYNLDVKFKYIATECNPADLLTRGISFTDFDKKFDVWVHGPKFIQTPGDIEWPTKRLDCLSETSKLLTMSNLQTEPSNPSIFPVKRFSSLNKLFSVTALVFEFIDRLKKKAKSKLTYINKAKLYWLKNEQAVHLSEELDFLHNQTKNRVPTLVNNLNLFLDPDGLIRCRGRLEHCKQLTYDVKNPVLLPRNSFLTCLFIEDAHCLVKHLGVPTTLAKLRMSGLWVAKGRMSVKAVLGNCITCKKINSFKFRYPTTTDYIKDKVNFAYAYQHVGIDFTGTVYIKFENQLKKMYILVLTCINTRAVHFELLPDLTCEHFLLAFVRFTNRYCIPAVVYSDNANTFIQAMGILAESNADNPFSNYLVRNNIRHLRIPLYSAWIGAAWERLIRVLKSSLHKVVGRKHLDYFKFITLLSDIQESVNSRPLTYADNEGNFITPNDFLKTHPGGTLLLDGDAGADIQVPTREGLVKALEERDHMLSDVMEKWTEQYLLSLRESSRDIYQVEWSEKIAVDDIVLISSPIKTRPHWTMGRVVQLLPGPDGRTRTVRICRPDRSEGVYAISLLYPLELTASPVCVDDGLLDSDENNQAAAVRPKRAAALKCIDKMRSN